MSLQIASRAATADLLYGPLVAVGIAEVDEPDIINAFSGMSCGVRVAHAADVPGPPAWIMAAQVGSSWSSGIHFDGPHVIGDPLHPGELELVQRHW